MPGLWFMGHKYHLRLYFRLIIKFSVRIKWSDNIVIIALNNHESVQCIQIFIVSSIFHCKLYKFSVG